MGKSITPKYVVEMDGTTGMFWHVRQHYQSPGNGKPTNENLAKYVQDYIDSLKPDGVNKHVSKALGYIPMPKWARIVRNDGSREILAEWFAPIFMTI